MSAEPQKSLQPLEEFGNYLLVEARRIMSIQLQREVDPSDMVQETFVKALRGAPFNGNTNAQKARWLKTTLCRVILDELDRLPPDPLTSTRIKVIADSGLSPEEEAERIEEAMLLANALMKLPPRQREAIILHKLQGLTVAETAVHMETTPVAVSGLLRRGMETLRDILD